MIFHLTTWTVWRRAVAEGCFTPPAEDIRDGFLHFSTADQLRESAALYGRGRRDLALISVDETLLGDSLRWEVSRGGMAFPHLYGDLPMEAIRDAREVALDGEGLPIISDDVFT